MEEKNSRNHQRVKLSRLAGIDFSGRYRLNCPTRDLSLTGLFIIGQFDQPVGTPCTIILTDRWTDQLINLTFTGKIARHSNDGVAIQFTEMALDQYALLQTVLLYGCSNPLSFGYEFAEGYPFEISEYHQQSA